MRGRDREIIKIIIIIIVRSLGASIHRPDAPREKEREREMSLSGRKRERQRETERQTERQTQTEREREREREEDKLWGERNVDRHRVDGAHSVHNYPNGLAIQTVHLAVPSVHDHAFTLQYYIKA